MKFLITGGNRGLGKHLTDMFSGTTISRSCDFDITKNPMAIATLSLGYDVFINNAFDGPPHEEWANFGQVQTYFSVYNAWKEANKSGYIFNIGSVGSKSIVAPEPRFETYRVAKSALEHASRQGTHSFKQNLIKFKTTLLTLDRIDTELSRGRPTWTGNGIDCNDITKFIQYSLTTHPNTCIEEASFYCNFNFES